MLAFNDNKAGMAGLDKERITKIIESNTSENYSNFSKKQQDRINEKTEAIKKRLQSVTPAEWARAEKEVGPSLVIVIFFSGFLRHVAKMHRRGAGTSRCTYRNHGSQPGAAEPHRQGT